MELLTKGEREGAAAGPDAASSRDSQQSLHHFKSIIPSDKRDGVIAPSLIVDF